MEELVHAASVMTVDDVRVTYPALAALQVAVTFGAAPASLPRSAEGR